MEDKPKVLIFIKAGYNDIEKFIANNFIYQIYRGTGKNKLPQFRIEAYKNKKQIILPKGDIGVFFEPDWIISFLSPWKIPKGILECAGKGAINFHPGPPKYPGIGCYNYAIWNEDRRYGVTLHYMEEDIDSGKIIEVRNFTLKGNETVAILKNRAILELKFMFYQVIDYILEMGNLPELYNSKFKWGDYHSRAAFQAFCKVPYIDVLEYIDLQDQSDLERFLRSTYFKRAPDGPYIEVNGVKWRLIPEYDL